MQAAQGEAELHRRRCSKPQGTENQTGGGRTNTAPYKQTTAPANVFYKLKLKSGVLECQLAPRGEMAAALRGGGILMSFWSAVYKEYSTNLGNFVQFLKNTGSLIFFLPTKHLFVFEALCLSLGYNYHHLSMKMILS